MGPKKTDPTLKDDYWRKRIETAPLNDDIWSVQVVMIEVAGSDQDCIYLNKFEKSAADGKRFVIRNICKSETMFMVNQLGGEKREKDENLRVFEEGQAYLKDKKDIPADIQALIVKQLILNMKEEYLFIQRQKLLVREGLHRESATMVTRTEVRALVSARQPDTTESRSQTQTNSKKIEVKTTPTDETQEGKKFNTVLRVRGEEWRDKVYVDDFPLDGPNLYVAVSGFSEPLLAGCLIAIGVPLTAICQIRIDLSAHHIPPALIPPIKRIHSNTDIMADKSLSYWQTLQELRINKITAQDFNDTAFIVFSPPYWDGDDLSGNADKIYDELCFLMYDIQDLTRQRTHYLENMDVIKIPSESKDDSYINDYLQHIDSVTLECCTMYSILDSILQAVCSSQDLDNIANQSSFAAPSTLQKHYSTEETKVQKAETLINDIFNVLNTSDSSKKSYRLTCREETYEEPIVIQNGNFAKFQTFHLNNMELDHMVLSMLLGMPINRLWLNQERPTDELKAKLSFHTNVLLSCFDRSDVESAELNRLLHIAACRKLYSHRSSLLNTHRSATTISEFKKHYLKRTALAEPLPKRIPICVPSIATSRSFPSMTNVKTSSSSTYTGHSSKEDKLPFLFDLPDISELVSVAEVTSEKPCDHVIDDFELFEDFTNICSFQVLHEAFNSFNCLDYKYCEITDTFNLMFFNSHDRNGIFREEWRSHIPTPVCLQDFFDFILEEHHDWIKNEEDLFQQKLVRYSQSVCSIKDLHAGISCIQNEDVETELVIEGSLKFQELRVKDDLEEQESLQSNNTVSAPVSTVISSKSTKTNKTTKKTKTTTISLDDSKTTVDIKPMPFRGYDLGEKRVEVYGKDDSFYSKDGTRIFCHYTFIIPMNLEYITLHFVPGNGSNEFWVHKFTGEGETSDIVNGCESFRITSKDRAIINIKKESYCEPIAIDTSLDDNVQPKIKQSPTSQEKLTLPQLETYHSLCITWPNGLITETVHEENSAVFSHIKQYYLSQPSDLDEEMRCISMNGEVILFKKSGDIDILQQDGTYIKITKCAKRVVPSLTNLISTSSPVDKKKNKKEVRDKKEVHDKKEGRGSAKAGQSLTKTSKTYVERENESPPINQEYKLYIDEFEIIEPNGLHQQWTREFSIDIEKILIRTVTDYCSGEILTRRMDGTQLLLNKDGIQIVTFPNQTRIITKFIVEDEEVYPDWTEDENNYLNCSNSVQSNHSSINNIPGSESHQNSTFDKDKGDSKNKIRTDGYISVLTYFIIEHENFATVIVNKPTGKVTIDSPNSTSVTLDTNNQYEIKLDSITTATFNGEDLNVVYEPCPECQSKTRCKIKICPDVNNAVNEIQESWVELEDSLGKKVVVNDEGAIQILKDKNERVTTSSVLEPHVCELVEDFLNIEPGDRASPQPDEPESPIEHQICRELFNAKEMRFFILRRDLTCSELVHRVLIERDKQLCRLQPWCSMNEYDTFGDHRGLLTMLTPVSQTESEKWVMQSQFAKIKRAFGDSEIDCGNNFYHWMRPYRRFKPDPYGVTVRQGLPRAFIMRVLERQWKQQVREKMKGGRELLRAVLRYRRLMETECEAIVKVPLEDYRPDSEQRVDEAVQALAHRVYEKLKEKLDKTVQSDDQLDITTEPPTPKYWSSKLIEKARGSDSVDVLKAHSLIQEAQVQPMTESLKQYWRRREEEYKEEQFYLYLLREGNVPPYFRNLLGGAIWWEVNNVATQAIDVAQMRANT